MQKGIGTEVGVTIHLNDSQKVTGERVHDMSRADESQEIFAGVSERVPEFVPPEAGPYAVGY